MKFLGLKMTLEEVEKMAKEFDDDDSGLIEFEEFLVMMANQVSSFNASTILSY